MARQRRREREGALDNTLIAHEWGHYISNRLVANVERARPRNQARGMGEGWADFHALLLLVKEADRALPGNAAFNGAYAGERRTRSAARTSRRTSLNNAYYYGIRRYPYSRDMAKNPLTFRHIADGVALPAPPPRHVGAKISSSQRRGAQHRRGVGERCCGSATANLLNDTGRLTFAQAQERMKRYLVGGVQDDADRSDVHQRARRAARGDAARRIPQDRDLCMQGFAKRGAGVGRDRARTTCPRTTSGVVESFKRDRRRAGTTTPVIEYYHAAFDHYFVTNIADEIGPSRSCPTVRVMTRAPRFEMRFRHRS